MSSGDTVVVDYEIGNVFSVCNAISHAGGKPILTGEHAKIARAERLVLPGVGAFGRAMTELQHRNLIEPIRAFCLTGRPFLGICVGMQVLMEYSTEGGEHAGIGILEGGVERLPATINGAPIKVPHIGWSNLVSPESSPAHRWKRTICEPFQPHRSAFYFVHSYQARPAHNDDVLAVVDYCGYHVVAAVQRDNIAGVQFHPERSGAAGRKLLRYFLAM